ncbi:MAG: multiheme c-type cytochrome, partial [Verrucomicrobiales bacterium]
MFALIVLFANLADSEQLNGEPPAKAQTVPPKRAGAEPQFFSVMELKDRPRMFHWFGDVPEGLRKFAIDRDNPSSNIHPRDYAGAKSCRECHEKNYKRWSNHSHRFMNAYATEENVQGDFSDGARIEFMGGVGEFYREDGKFRMRLEREQVRVYDIYRTIGSRFTQYYVGKLIDGPEPSDHVTRRVDHLLPFGYWMEPREWVPVVNVGSGEGPDLERDDPFIVQDKYPYDRSCSECHTTKATGDTLMSEGMMNRIDAYAPRTIHFALENYLRESHPEILEGIKDSPKLSKEQMTQTLGKGLD